ncbi:MAG: glycosyltransferase family 4 protein [Patescibacteria group bacterium]|nr:glycosyltransferase family 4 protein [Patescibacteria group bacterium]
MAKIGIDIRMMGTAHGGIGRYVKELVFELLKNTKRSNNEYVLFYNSDLENEGYFQQLAKDPKAKLVKCNIRHYSLREQWNLIKLIRKEKVELMHFPNFNLPVLYNEPFVVTIHDMVHHKISGAKKTHLVHFWAYKKVIEHAARAARAIVTVSEYSKKDIVRLLGVPESRVRVVYEGVSLPGQASLDQTESVKRKYFIDRPYFLFVGVLERKKNLVNLARGFDVFIQKYRQDMDLVIAGKADSHYPEIRHKVLDIKNRNRLVLTDYVVEGDLNALYSGAYAFVSASLHEGFGLPGLEAMRFGLPLAVSNTEVFNEIYDNAAIYFNPLDPDDIAEKMQLLARDAGFRQKISENASKRSSEFSWEKAAVETESVYAQAILSSNKAL